MSPAKPVRLRALALADLEAAISHYLQMAGPEVALGFIEVLQQAYTHLGRQPGTGSPRYAHELNLPGLRSWPLTRYPYLVFYVEQAEHLDVWRVLHSARDVPTWLSEGDPALPSAA
jgi:toxin ParE1/3/4